MKSNLYFLGFSMILKTKKWFKIHFMIVTSRNETNQVQQEIKMHYANFNINLPVACNFFSYNDPIKIVKIILWRSNLE